MTWQKSEKSIFLSRIYELKRRRAYSEMEEEVQTALERYPTEARFQVLLADVRWQQGQRQEAQSILEDLADRAKDLDSFQALRGTFQLEQRRPEQALESFRNAHALKPKPFYLKRQADCLLRLGRHEEALGLLRQCRDERDPYLLGAMARAHEGLGENDRAKRCYEEILELKPGDSFARGQLLRLRAAEKDQPETLQELERMLRMPSLRDDVALLELKADNLQEQGRLEEATRVYERLVELTSGREKDRLRRTLAFAYYRTGMEQPAYDMLLELAGVQPRDPYLRNTLIALARRLERVSELADFFSRLARASPENRFLYGVSRKLRSSQ